MLGFIDIVTWQLPGLTFALSSCKFLAVFLQLPWCWNWSLGGTAFSLFSLGIICKIFFGWPPNSHNLSQMWNGHYKHTHSQPLLTSCEDPTDIYKPAARIPRDIYKLHPLFKPCSCMYVVSFSKAGDDSNGRQLTITQKQQCGKGKRSIGKHSLHCERDLVVKDVDLQYIRKIWHTFQEPPWETELNVHFYLWVFCYSIIIYSILCVHWQTRFAK